MNKDEKKAMTVTIVYHAVLILLFIFTGLAYLEPPPPEQGILINFGYDNQGSGEVQAQSNVQTEQQIVKEDISRESTASKAVEDMLTQNSEEAPKINTEKSESIREEEVVKEEPKPSKELSNALSKWKNKSDNTSTSDGITGQQGDQGDPSGSLESGSYVGGAGGGGFSFNLSGRKMISKPKISDVSQDEGKVVVDIIVDKYGNVVRASPGARGSTTTSDILYKIAKDAALSTRFNTNASAPEQQKGQIVFTFLLKG